MVERFEELRGKTITIELYQFITNLLYDFKSLSSTLVSSKLDTLLRFIDVDPKDIRIIIPYANFLTAATQCCLGSSDTDSLFKVAKAIDAQLKSLVEGLNVYKDDYENVASAYCNCGL